MADRVDLGKAIKQGTVPPVGSVLTELVTEQRTPSVRSNGSGRDVGRKNVHLVAVKPKSRHHEEVHWDEQAALAPLRDDDQGFRTLVQNSVDILVTFDEHATFLYVSPATQRLLGINPADAIGMNGFDFVHPDDRDASASRFRDILEHPGPHGPSEFRVRRADGTFAVLEAVSNNLLNDPAVGAVVMNARDVTERTSLSRALRTLGLGNEVLVHATDETALLADTCENIVASSGYLLAWVGYVEHDRGHTVRPSRVGGTYRVPERSPLQLGQ